MNQQDATYNATYSEGPVRKPAITLFNNSAHYMVTAKDAENQSTHAQNIGTLMTSINNTEELKEILPMATGLAMGYRGLGSEIARGLTERFSRAGKEDRQAAIHEIDVLRSRFSSSHEVPKEFQNFLKIQSIKHNALNMFGL